MGKRTGLQKGKGNRRSGGLPLRFALVGCGGMGRWHARELLAIPEIEVVALCDIVKRKMREFQKEFYAPAGLDPKCYGDYEEMLAAETLDAVVLVTPHTTHYPQALAALNRGIHVLSEKPMVTNSEHARELVATAAEKDLLLAVGFQATVSGEFAYARDVIRRGGLGRLELVDVVVAQRWKELSAGTWRQDPKYSGGGQLYDSGAHMLNSMMWLVNSPVKRVFALADNCETPVDINGTVSVVFENGCLGSVACAGNSTIPIDSGVTVYGGKGTIKTGIWGEKLEHWDAAGNKIKYPHVRYPTVAPERNFTDALLGKDTLRCPGRYGVLLAELMDAIYESVETGLPVEVRHRMRPMTLGKSEVRSQK